MKPNILVHRYAKAFLDLAIQNNVVDKVLDDLLLVKTTLEGNKELNILMHQPFVSTVHKTNIINKIFKDRVEKITLGEDIYKRKICFKVNVRFSINK